MPPELYHALTGVLGGLIRGLVGITKSQTFTPEQFKFQWKYFGFSLLVSAIVGVMSGIIADGDWRVSLLAGYAGTDFLEGLYRLKFSQFFRVS
ncbi:hypothetical protein HZB69_01005 [Candidatus Amesbacteria bacterium]|nr:hypothetical protein [Candidatus Amesbacteria bacterium]